MADLTVCGACGRPLDADNVWEPGVCRKCAPGCLKDWQCVMGTNHEGDCDWGDDDT